MIGTTNCKQITTAWWYLYRPKCLAVSLVTLSILHKLFYVADQVSTPFLEITALNGLETWSATKKSLYVYSISILLYIMEMSWTGLFKNIEINMYLHNLNAQWRQHEFAKKIAKFYSTLFSKIQNCECLIRSERTDRQFKKSTV